MASEPLLEILEDLAPAELFQEACKLSAAKGWYFGHGSHDHDPGRFWKMDLEGIVVFDEIWKVAKTRCEELTGGPIRVLRQYANGHTYGLGGQPHLDDHRPGSYTLLYYPMAEWQDGWEGETLFFDEQGEVAFTVRPRPNRAVLFDSRILHVGRAPSRACTALRVTVAYKLEAETSLEQPAADEPSIAASSDAVREFTVRVSESRIRQLTEEKLLKLGETVRLPGFRASKIPLSVLEQRYGASARAEILTALATDAAAKTPPEGSIVSNVDVKQGPEETEFRVTAVHVPSLADPDLSQLRLMRLTAGESELESLGLTPAALGDHLNQQVLDFLDQSYTFPLPGAAVEKELAAILGAMNAQGQSADSEAEYFRKIAERRLRLGIVIAELGRRYQMSGADLENQVLQRLMDGLEIETRPATAEELEEL